MGTFFNNQLPNLATVTIQMKELTSKDNTWQAIMRQCSNNWHNYLVDICQNTGGCWTISSRWYELPSTSLFYISSSCFPFCITGKQGNLDNMYSSSQVYSQHQWQTMRTMRTNIFCLREQGQQKLSREEKWKV